METHFPVDDQSDNTWKSCCLSMDRRAVQFFSQLAAISATMGLCIFKLGTDSSQETQVSYTALLTLMIGVVVPSPKFK
jgi:hypothetical protein